MIRGVGSKDGIGCHFIGKADKFLIAGGRVGGGLIGIGKGRGITIKGKGRK